MWDGPNFENPIKRAPANERMFATNMALILKIWKARIINLASRLDKIICFQSMLRFLPKTEYFNVADRASWGILNHDCYFDLSVG